MFLDKAGLSSDSGLGAIISSGKFLPIMVTFFDNSLVDYDVFVVFLVIVSTDNTSHYELMCGSFLH